MRIIARYITKEILWAFLVVTGILLLIVLSNRFALYLTKAATGELPVGLVFKIVGLYIPELLSYLIPLGFFMAIIFAYGRLYADSEMTVLAACGISSKYIIQLTLVISFFMMFITATLTLWVVPEVTALREEALSEGEAAGVMQSMLPGRFQTFSDGRLVFYLEDVASKKEVLKGIFIAERPNNIEQSDQGWTLITAEQARVKSEQTNDSFYLVLKSGHRYQGVPGQANYSVTTFEEYGRAIPRTVEKQNDVLRLKNSVSLMRSSEPVDAAELQWRLSLPLTVPILALIAIPLARVNPRHGRFAKLLPAIVVYIVYYNLFTVCRRWVESGTLPSYIGVWWVHVLFLLIGIGLVAKEMGWLRRVRDENTR